MICDAHCHFFSRGFFRTLARDLAAPPEDPEDALPARLGWDPSASDEALADRWVAEMDRHGVHRIVAISSVPGDESSVAAAVARHPSRFVGAFMFNPAMPDADARIERAFSDPGLRMACLFPAMHGVSIDDERSRKVFEVAERHGRAVFVHCGVLSVGVRKKLGLLSRFDLRKGDPLAVAALAVRYPSVPVVIPHFGAGLFREALMAADAAPNIVLDSSSSNGWIKFHPGLTLRDAFARALDVVGPARILFGTDSSFFPRGWQKAIYDNQRSLLDELDLAPAAHAQILGGNFSRVFAQS
jgi:hypothetical protein